MIFKKADNYEEKKQNSHSLCSGAANADTRHGSRGKNKVFCMKNARIHIIVNRFLGEHDRIRLRDTDVVDGLTFLKER